MKRRLILMRHAQSAAGTIATADHDRPVTEHGKKQAVEIAERLVELTWNPQLVIASDARRTRETWEQMAPAFPSTPQVNFEETLYLAGVDAIQTELFAVGDEITNVLVLGHNPGLQNGITYFSGLAERLGTATAALLEGQGRSWTDAAVSGNFQCVEILRPSPSH